MSQSSLVPLSRFAKVRRFAAAHKIISGIVLVLTVSGGWYWYSQANTATAVTRYVIEKATTGTVIASVTGSGQMQAGTTIDIKPENSETVVAIPVRVGQTVKVGQLLVQLDATDQARALAQAQLSLRSAQLALEKLTAAPATTTLIQTQNAVVQDEANLVSASTTLAKDYQSGFDTLGGSFVDFQNVMLGLQNFVQGNDISKAQNDPDAYVNLLPNYVQATGRVYRNDVQSAFTAAQGAYQQNLIDYHATSRIADPQTLDTLFAETYQTAKTISEAVKAVKDLLNFVVNNFPTGQGMASLPVITNTLQTNFGTYTNTANGDVSNIGNAINTITSDKTSLTNAQLALNQASSSLMTLLAGADPLDVQSSQLSVQQQQLAVQTAQENLAADYIRAPISGVVSDMPSVVGATVSSPAVSIVGDGQVAEVTLNEVDAAKVKVGNKAMLTFDAISGLSLAGQVVEIDPVGTVSQGVVSYNVQIALAAQNDQVRPGMSVNVIIVTQADQDVIAVPSAAVIKQGTASYILEPASQLSDADIASSSVSGIELPVTPVRVPVTTGISGGGLIEILSGVNAGDQIIVQTMSGAAGASTARTATTGGGSNVFRALGGGLGGAR